MKINMSFNKFIILLFVFSLFLSLFVSPFASSSPDGLEKIAEKHNFINKEKKLFEFGVFSDYNFKLIKDEKLSTAFSGFVGTILAFSITYLVFKFILRK